MVGIIDHHQGDTQFGGEPDLRLVDLGHQSVQAALLVGVGVDELPGVQFHVEAVPINVEQRPQLLACPNVITGLDVAGELGNHAAV